MGVKSQNFGAEFRSEVIYEKVYQKKFEPRNLFSEDFKFVETFFCIVFLDAFV
jgi:hypothetical protein